MILEVQRTIISNSEERGLSSSYILLNLLDIRVTCLYPFDGAVDVRFNNKVIHISLRNNLEVQLSKLFIQRWLLYLNFKFRTVSFAAQGIDHHISLARGIRNIHVEVVYCLEPSLMTKI